MAIQESRLDKSINWLAKVANKVNNLFKLYALMVLATVVITAISPHLGIVMFPTFVLAPDFLLQALVYGLIIKGVHLIIVTVETHFEAKKATEEQVHREELKRGIVTQK